MNEGKGFSGNLEAHQSPLFPKTSPSSSLPFGQCTLFGKHVRSSTRLRIDYASCAAICPERSRRGRAWANMALGAFAETKGLPRAQSKGPRRAGAKPHIIYSDFECESPSANMTDPQIRKSPKFRSTNVSAFPTPHPHSGKKTLNFQLWPTDNKN